VLLLFKTKIAIVPTQKPRISLTLDPETASLLGAMAQLAHQSTSSLAKELILEALERREDVALATLADLRSIENGSTVKHNDAWD
jgi:predicted transcriptional regulator